MQKDQHSSGAKHHEGQKETTNRHVYVEPGVQIDIVKGLKDQHESERQEDKATQGKQLLWTRVTAGLVFIYALLTLWQAWTANQALFDGRRHFERDHRAWVGVIDQEWNPPNPPSATLINFGSVPALTVEVRIMGTVGPAGTRPPFEELAKVKTPWKSTGALFPNIRHEISTTVTVTTLSSDILAKIADGTYEKQFFGIVTYEDQFGIKHYTHFCYVSFPPKIGMPGHACDTHNDAN